MTALLTTSLSVVVSDGEVCSASEILSLGKVRVGFSASTFYPWLPHYLGRPVAFFEKIFCNLPASPTTQPCVFTIGLTLERIGL
jgi:hypothetical protein